MVNMETIVLALSGALTLVLGRKLFWLFVGVAGFIAGLHVADFYFRLHPIWVLWTAGLICGVTGALLAFFLQHVAIGIGGLLAGGTIALYMMHILDLDPVAWVVLIGGIIGMVALILFFDWALILLSSMLGATVIVQAVGPQLPLTGPIATVLFIGGVIVQIRLRGRGKK